MRIGAWRSGDSGDVTDWAILDLQIRLHLRPSDDLNDVSDALGGQ